VIWAVRDAAIIRMIKGDGDYFDRSFTLSNDVEPMPNRSSILPLQQRRMPHCFLRQAKAPPH